MKLLVMMVDEQGFPRAWASGPDTEFTEVRQHAHRQLEAYVEKKRALGEPLAVEDFTEKVTVLKETP